MYATLSLFIFLISSFLLSLCFAIFICRRMDNGTTTVAGAVPTSATTPTILLDHLQDIGHGLDPAVVESFPLIPYKAIKGLKTVKGRMECDCAVCLSEFADHETLRLLPGCCHVFHPGCISVWLDSHSTCPVCRSDLSDPSVIANDRCMAGGKEAAAAGAADVESGVMDGREIRRAASLAGRWSGGRGRWEAVLRTLSGRWRREGESKRVFPVFNIDEMMMIGGSSSSPETRDQPPV